MADLLLSLRSYFKTDYDITDNNLCRLHYKATVAVLLAFSALVTGKQYFGDPIDCVVPKDSIDTKMLDTYCWIHKTFSVEKAFRGELGDEVAYPGVAPHTKGDKLVYHSYYQWVCFVLFLQAGTFYLPRFIWKMFEGHRIRHLTTDLRSPVLSNKKREENITLLVDYMQENRKQHKLYFAGLVLCEILYFLNTILQMYVIDLFLGGEFSQYGWKVLQFTEWSWEARYDPMIKVFPRMTKCTFRMYGTSGDIQTIDAICVLPINIINEKIYVFLWFWLVGVTIITGIWLIYRAATIFLPDLRYNLMSRNAQTLDIEVLRGVLRKSDRGDWFILYQLSKNIDVLHFRTFMEQYALTFSDSELTKLIDVKKK